MEVLALVGDSGTGKSTSALQFAYEQQIPAIIDDGLFIFNGRKIAGTSAKYEKNFVTAIKRATFFHEEHKRDVQASINQLKPEKILLIGTSKKMVTLISERLQLNKISTYYDVSDIRTKQEIKSALFTRKTKNEHVIPIPYIQVESTIFKKIIHRGKKIFSSQRKLIGETTIVQPNFQQGSIIISESIFKDVLEHSLLDFKSIQLKSFSFAIYPVPSLDCYIEVSSPLNELSPDLTIELQKHIHSIFNGYFEIELFPVNVYVTKLSIKENKEVVKSNS